MRVRTEANSGTGFSELRLMPVATSARNSDSYEGTFSPIKLLLSSDSVHKVDLSKV
jgi:hypothetical protein